MKRAYFALILTILFVLISPALLRAAQSAESIMADSSLRSTGPSTFLVPPSIPLGYAPSSVATGDLRQSGKLDLVTADYNSGGITVFLGDGQGNFAPGVKYDAGPHPSSVVVVDIDGDGRPDVLVSNGSEGTISVLLGSGDGTLRPRQSYAVGFNPSFIATGDFNGNGKVDVAVAGESGSLLAILLNDGDGNLQKPVLRSLSKTPTALAVADFNNDGHADLALANADGTVSIVLGKGAGLFRSLPDISVASGSLSSINSGDLNNDGKIDLVVTQLGQKLVSVLIGRGDGTFASPASYPVGNEPISTLVADVNGDGVPALVVINKSSNTFSILVGNGDGTFKSSIDFVAGNAPLAAVAGDFYGNGHVDLAIINHSSQTVSVPLGNGDGTFKAARSYSAGVQPVSIASGNLNGSKIPALVVANYCGSDLTCSAAGSVAVFLADDKGAYKLSSTYTVGAGPVSVALADLKGDRNLDIVALNRLDKSASVMLGLGDGTFRMPMTFSLAGAPVAIAVGDLNKDGKPDLAVLEDCGSAKCSQAGSVEILMGAGDGSFQSVLSYPVGYSPVSVAVGAINGDKNLDLVVANRCGKDASCQSAGTATVLIGDGTGKFTPGTDIALGNSPSSIALGNLTGSRLDLVISRSTDNTVAVLHGNGDGTFRAAVPYPVGNNPGSLVVADFNGDGNADVVVANVNDSTVSVLFGKGDGTLQPATTLAVGSGPTSLTAVGRINTRHASLATTNGNGGSSSPGTEFTLLPNLGTDPPLASFAVAASPTPSSVNESVLLIATLTGVSPNPAPSGTVTFDSGATALSDCTGVSITQGVSPSLISTATCTTQMLTAGSDSLTAVYSGDTIYDTGVGETSPVVTQTVSPIFATFGLTSPGASSVNASVTFTAQLSGVALTPVVPSGKVAFTANRTTITGCGAVAVNASGAATCPTSSLGAPSDAIKATYSGDANFTVAAPAAMTQTVNALAATLGLTGSPAAVAVGTSVTFTAQLSGVALTPVVPSGTVTFTINGSPSSNCPAVNVSAAGAATCTTSSLVVPADVITATYSGDPNFTVANPATFTETVSKTAAQTALKSSLSPSSVNQTVTFTATVTPSSGTVLPTGTVTFTQGATTLCGATGISSTTGIATCSYAFSSVTAGTMITATYSGDSNFSAGTPGTFTQVVAAASTMTSVVSSPNPSAVNQQVILTATVTPAYTAGTAKPTGTVVFSNTSTTPVTTLCTETIANGTVPVCSYTFTSSGSNSVVATYTSGDANFLGSTSGVLIQQVNSATVATLSPTSLNFGNVAIGTTSAPKSVKLTNPGSIPLNIININSGDTGVFKLSANTCGTSLAPGKYCWISVVFAPNEPGPTDEDVLSVYDDAANSPQTVSLLGTVEAQTTWSPISLTFAPQAVGTTSAPKIVTLTNNLPTALSISGISFTGTDPGDFVQTNTCGGSVAAKAKCTISVTFTPPATGIRTATLNVSDSASNSPQTVSLTGTGIVPATLTPTSATYAAQAEGTTSAAKTFTLTNNQTVVLTGIAISTTGDFAVSATTCTTSLAAKGKCTISVTFTPTAAGKRTGQLSVSDSASNSPQTVTLTGTGVVPATLAPASFTYAKQKVGTTSAAKTFTLTNKQNVALTSIAISVSAPFAVSATTCTTSLAASATCTISVTFTPEAAESFEAALFVYDSASNSPQFSFLLGTGD